MGLLSVTVVCVLCATGLASIGSALLDWCDRREARRWYRLMRIAPLWTSGAIKRVDGHGRRR